MKFEKKTILAGSLILVAAILIALKFATNETPDALPNPTTQPADRAASRSNSPKTPHSAPGSQPDGGPTAKPGLSDEATQIARTAAIDKMQEASTSYDPAQLPVIQPYLVSPDPELRVAAVNAMIVLGDASAGPLIREAAKSMSSADEAKKMEEAADYVELPPVDFKKMAEEMKKRKTAKAAEKNAATEP